MKLTLHPNAAYTGHGSYQHHKGTEDGPKPGHREPTREGTMPEVLGDRPRPQRRRDIRAKAFEGDRRGIDGDRRRSKDLEGPRRISKDLEGRRRSSRGRRRYSGDPYGLVRRWRGLSRSG